MRVLLTLISFLLIAFCWPSPGFAQTDFLVDSNIEYKVTTTGAVDVTNTVKIENATSLSFPKGYQLSFSRYRPENFKVYENGKLVPTKINEVGGKFEVLINFEDISAGINSQKTFLITYQIGSFAKNSGDIWEINIPTPTNLGLYKRYAITLEVPRMFGRENFFSLAPALRRVLTDSNVFVFLPKEDGSGNIYISFGDFQTYDFEITYHLENPLDKPSYSQIALPPDTNYQRVYFNSIIPKPSSVSKDADGNFMAIIDFKPREKIDVVTTGFVQVFAKPLVLPKTPVGHLSKLLKEDQYWEINDPLIRQLSSNLKTPRQIYDYLQTTLVYRTDDLRDKRIERLGASRALATRNENLCTEFSDSFIALARAAGIPTREINGYALASDKKAHPLSLVEDILHSWVEYWHEDSQTWKQVDPTWAQTSGLNYFDSFDLKHIAFVIHGENSVYPYSAGTYKLGPTPQNDVKIAAIKNPPLKETNHLDITYKSRGLTSPFYEFIDITVTNSGNGTIYDFATQTSLDEKIIYQRHDDYLLPTDSVAYTIKVPYNFLGLGMADHLVHQVAENQINIPLTKVPRIVIHIVGVMLILIVILFPLALKLRRLLLWKK